VIAGEFDRLIAFRYDLTMPRGFHKLSSFVVASALGQPVPVCGPSAGVRL
jgi:hypothetical protein